MQGKTKTGFEFAISDELKDDYEFVEKCRMADKNALNFVDLVAYVLGEEQAEKLKDHCRVDGRVSIKKIRDEVIDIISTNPETKK